MKTGTITCSEKVHRDRHLKLGTNPGNWGRLVNLVVSEFRMLENDTFILERNYFSIALIILGICIKFSIHAKMSWRTIGVEYHRHRG